MKPVRAIYESFGVEVIREVENYLSQHGDLSELLQRFHLQVPSRLEQQHEILSQFLYKYGITFFLKALHNNLSSAEIEHLKVAKLVSRVGSPVRPRDTTATAAPTADRAKPPSLRSLTPVPLDCVPDSNVTSTPPPDGVAPAKGAESSVTAPLPTVEAGSHLPVAGPKGSTITEINGRKWIVTADYVGWDRRSGRDRRSNVPDRRRDTAVVFKNRRFGGRDRRKLVRRAEDRERMKTAEAARGATGTGRTTGTVSGTGTGAGTGTGGTAGKKTS